MTEGSKGFGGFSGLSRTGVTQVVFNRPPFFFVVNHKKLAMLKWARLSYACTRNPVNPPNPFEPSVIDA